MASRKLTATMLTLATISGWFHEIAQDPPPELNKPMYIRRAAQGENHAQKLLEAAVANIDKETVESICRKVKNYTARMIPKDKAERAENTMVVEVKDVEYILGRCFADCETCLKNEAEVKGCEMRKVLLRMEVIPKGTPRNVCPYQP